LNGPAEALERIGCATKRKEVRLKELRWETTPRWYLWDGGYLLFGRSQGAVPAHAHHAIQIVVTLEGECGIRGKNDDWRFGRGVIVLPNVTHQFDGNGAVSAMLFVEPESLEGVWLRSALVDPVTIIPPGRAEPAAAELRKFIEQPLQAHEIGASIRHAVHSLCAGVPPARRIDPRVTSVLKTIRDSKELRITAEEAAATVALSPSRFSHLFKQQVGLPFRRYMLWRKLTRAMLAIGRERTLAAAAHASDFADAAHLTRTFLQMFGIVPSLLMRGEFFVVPSPFDLPEGTTGA